MRASPLTFLLLLASTSLLGCGDKNEDDTATTDDTGEADTDTDTDDTGETDEPLPVDADADGFDETEDCDDTSDTVYPGADELCDEIDNDCDDEIDEEPVDGLTFYSDVDADGFGDETTASISCSQPTGTVEDATDCDDGEATTNPDAEEICLDGVDNNCDGTAEGCALEETLNLETAEVLIRGSAVGEYFGGGIQSLSTGDATGNGMDDLLVGVDYVTSGSVRLFHGETLSGEMSSSDADVVFTNQSGYSAGHSVALGGDLDADGMADVVIADPDGESAVYLFTGGVAGELDIQADATATISSTDTSAQLGYDLADGDFDGDGSSELIISAYGAGSMFNGGVFLFSGDQKGDLVAEDDADWMVSGDSFSFFGSDVQNVGDLDGDGDDELLVGAVYANSYAGGVYLFDDPTSGSLSMSDADGSIAGEAGGITFFGMVGSVAGGGDLNDDGYDDFAVGSAFSNDAAGVSYVFFDSPETGALAADADVRIEGLSGVTGFAGGMLSMGDVDGDGSADLMLLSSGGDTVKDAGAYLFLGPLTGGTLSVADAEHVIQSDSADSDMENEIDISGDFNGDGANEMLLVDSAWAGNGSNAGSVSVFFGPGL
ncbi:MAG: hypothetical protein ACI8RZ_002030 [Myxococcota bacterium]|jgi:hypothetical protein